MDDQDQFNTWCNQWEKAQAKWGKPDRSAPLHKFEPGTSFGGTGGWGDDAPPQQQPARRPQQDQGGGSFFGMHRQEPPSETLTENGDLPWREIYLRGLKLWAEQELPPDAQRVNEDSVPTKNNGKYTGAGRQANPVQPWTGGMDASPSPKRPAHVTPNFSDGPELRELATLRDKLARLESTLAAVEFGHQRGKKERLMDQIRALHRQADDLSDRLCPPPLEDIA